MTKAEEAISKKSTCAAFKEVTEVAVTLNRSSFGHGCGSNPSKAINTRSNSREPLLNTDSQPNDSRYGNQLAGVVKNPSTLCRWIFRASLDECEISLYCFK
jgi:hypothetical protein